MNGSLWRLRPILRTVRGCCVTRPWCLRGQLYGMSLDGLNEEIKSFYAMHKRGHHGDDNDADICEINRKNWLNKRLSLLKQSMKMVKSKGSSISFHQVLFDPIYRQLNWVNYDLCLIEDWDFSNVLPNISQLVKEAKVQANNQCCQEKQKGSNSEGDATNDDIKMSRDNDFDSDSFGERNDRTDLNKWAEIRIVYSSPANRKFFLEFAS